MKPLLSIQYLRALAVFAVVLFHEGAAYQFSFAVGQAGVDLFFVISGFIMYAITEDKEPAPGLFAERRLIRIVPLYWAVTLLSAAICLIRPHFLWAADIRPSHLIASLFFIPHTNAIGKDWPTVLQGWTLNIEMFFYLVTALALFLPRRFQLPAISIFFIGAVALGQIFSPQSAILKAYSDNLLLEFTAGLWIGWLYVKRRLPSPYMGLSLLALGLLFFVGDPWINRGVLPSLRAISWGIPAALIVMGALAFEARAGVMEIPLLKRLGDASYSIYLLHDIVIAAIKHLPLGALPKSICATFVAGAVGFFSFMYFERPSNARLKKIGALAASPQK